jgi:hypothetical protein
MTKLAMLQLVQPVGAKCMKGGPMNQETRPHPLQVFPTQC